MKHGIAAVKSRCSRWHRRVADVEQLTLVADRPRAVAATWLPARRAVSIDPAASRRAE
jgi:hypothetical protein